MAWTNYNASALLVGARPGAATTAGLSYSIAVQCVLSHGKPPFLFVLVQSASRKNAGDLGAQIRVSQVVTTFLLCAVGHGDTPSRMFVSSLGRNMDR